ncbi:MAG: hypothetical protein E7296_00525 [Lachnospiraceae bacterium]|nr:hypothetical protein [Lachnospiraceae bacterium]
MKRKMTVTSGGSSFVLEVKSCENSTWQGTLTWVEGNKKEHFRSVIEMLRLIRSTMNVAEE